MADGTEGAEREFISNEQAFQFNKAVYGGHLEIAEAIMKLSCPYRIKDKGNEIVYPRGHKWWTDRLIVVKRIIDCKFDQHVLLGDLLCASGTTKLIESTKSTFWGGGREFMNRIYDIGKCPGENNCGRLLMNKREEIAARKQLVTDGEDPNAPAAPTAT